MLLSRVGGHVVQLLQQDSIRMTEISSAIESKSSRAVSTVSTSANSAFKDAISHRQLLNLIRLLVDLERL